MQDEILMILSVMTMWWLGEVCSSYEHDNRLCVWCIKEFVNESFASLYALSAKMSCSCAPCKCGTLTSMWWCYE